MERKGQAGRGGERARPSRFFFFAGHEFDVPTLTLDPVNAKGRADLLTLVNSASADICARVEERKKEKKNKTKNK